MNIIHDTTTASPSSACRTPLPLRGVSAIAACICVNLFIAGCERDEAVIESPPRLVSATRLQATGAQIEGEFPGRAAAAQELELSFRVNGRIVELPAKVGDAVRAGQTLAQLDRRDFQVAVEMKEGQLAKAQADAEVAHSDYVRGVNIQKENPGAISQAMIDRRAGEWKQATATVLSIKASLEDARNALADTTLKAPFDAMVVERYVENFEEVQAKSPILRLVDSSRVKMTFYLPEQFISLLPEVASFICRFDAFADIDIPARLHEVGTEALATTRTYPVTLIMDQPQGAAILPGMSGKVRIRLKPGAMGTAGGMIVPVAAVFANEQDQKFVWVVDPQTKRVNRKQVQVTRVLPQGLLIEGLTPGTWVVNAGVHFLTENQEVRLPMTEGDAS